MNYIIKFQEKGKAPLYYNLSTPQIWNSNSRMAQRFNDDGKQFKDLQNLLNPDRSGKCVQVFLPTRSMSEIINTLSTL